MSRELAYKITKIVTLAAVALVLVWDIYAQIAHGLTATVSYAVWEFCKVAPFIPFLTGFVMGHLFWGSPLSQEHKQAIEKWERKKNARRHNR